MVPDYYDSIASGYDELHGEEQIKKWKIVAEHLDVKPNTSLDVGCGSAPYADLIDFPVTGIDPSAKLLEQCPYQEKQQGKAEELPFPDDSFDLVFSLTAAQNFTDIERGIKEMARVSKGKVIITYLKRSEKAEEIEKAITKHLSVTERIEEDKDIVLFCEKQAE